MQKCAFVANKRKILVVIKGGERTKPIQQLLRPHTPLSIMCNIDFRSAYFLRRKLPLSCLHSVLTLQVYTHTELHVNALTHTQALLTGLCHG